MNLSDYDYFLPKELIAQTAGHPRDYCGLMVLHGRRTEHKNFYQIIDYLQPGDVLVLNETKVMAAKLPGKKETGGKVEVILTGKEGTSYSARIKGSKIREGTRLLFNHNRAEVIKLEGDIFYLKFFGGLKKKDLIIPTPQYIKQKVPEKDYQTIFARKAGSLAAPTAGLHFTRGLLKKIEQKGVKIAKINLNISYETFLPVRDINHHQTGREYFEIDKRNADLINSAKNLFAVGTTVIKCLESAKRKNGRILPQKDYSTLFIKPGHQFKTNWKGIITNFHLPQSSLLLLASAYVDWDKLKLAYAEAVKKKYRFFSLGDAMLILK